MPNPLMVWVLGNLFKPETFGMTSYVLTPQKKKTPPPDAFTEHLAESEVDVPAKSFDNDRWQPWTDVFVDTVDGRNPAPPGMFKTL